MREDNMQAGGFKITKDNIAQIELLIELLFLNVLYKSFSGVYNLILAKNIIIIKQYLSFCNKKKISRNNFLK